MVCLRGVPALNIVLYNYWLYSYLLYSYSTAPPLCNSRTGSSTEYNLVLTSLYTVTDEIHQDVAYTGYPRINFSIQSPTTSKLQQAQVISVDLIHYRSPDPGWATFSST